MASTFIGIDPGQGGGIAILRDGQSPETHKMPETTRDLFDLLIGIASSDAVAFMENVHSSPQMGVASAFKFGRGVGELHMGLIAASIRIELVTPQKWQRAMGLKPMGAGIGQRDTDKKNRNKARAQERFPGMKITHAIADALLIADYGRSVYRAEAVA